MNNPQDYNVYQVELDWRISWYQLITDVSASVFMSADKMQLSCVGKARFEVI